MHYDTEPSYTNVNIQIKYEKPDYVQKLPYIQESHELIKALPRSPENRRGLNFKFIKFPRAENVRFLVSNLFQSICTHSHLQSFTTKNLDHHLRPNKPRLLHFT